jgi:hypothetical protein
LHDGWTSIHRVRDRLASPSPDSVASFPPSLSLPPQAIFSRCGSVKKVRLSSPVARVVSSSTAPERYRYTLHDKSGEALGEYDAVVMTAPMSPVHPIEFLLDDEPLDLSPYLAQYQVTHATFVKGTLSKEYFLRPRQSERGGGALSAILQTVLGQLYEDPGLLPSHVFIVDGADKKVLPLHLPLSTSPASPLLLLLDDRSGSRASESILISRCISLLALTLASSSLSPSRQGGSHQHSLYKIFSREPLSLETLSALFSPESSVVLTKKWWAYPLFSPPENISLPFRMKSRHSVFNSSVLERSVAAMEVSAVSGRNAALLVQKDLMRDALCASRPTPAASPTLQS